MDVNMFPDLPSKKQRIRDIQDKETGDLFAQPAPAVKSETSQEAAGALSVETRVKRMLDVKNALESIGENGYTRQEVADLLDIPVNYLTSTFDRLLDLREIFETARKRTNPKSGKGGFVLVGKRFSHLDRRRAA